MRIYVDVCTCTIALVHKLSRPLFLTNIGPAKTGPTGPVAPALVKGVEVLGMYTWCLEVNFLTSCALFYSRTKLSIPSLV